MGQDHGDRSGGSAMSVLDFPVRDRTQGQDKIFSVDYDFLRAYISVSTKEQHKFPDLGSTVLTDAAYIG